MRPYPPPPPQPCADTQTRAGLRELASCALVMAACIAASYFVPGLEVFRPWTADEQYLPFWNLLGRDEAELEGEVDEFDGLETDTDTGDDDLDIEDDDAPLEQWAEQPPEPLPGRELDSGEPAGVIVRAQGQPEDADRPRYPIYDEAELVTAKRPLENPEALEHFFERLTLTDLKHADTITRVSHWGDSMIGNDGITAAIRRSMQARFGDSGHGFHALSKYDASYRHQGIEFSEDGSWERCYIIRKNQRCARDSHFGYGGAVSFTRRRARSRFATATKGRYGRKVSRFELWYQAQPKGGDLEISVDGARPERISTRSELREDRWWSTRVVDGAHEFEVAAAGSGEIRAYGAVLERDEAGVVWDGMALIGSFTDRLSFQDQDHFSGQVRHRSPDLIVVSFGGNDLGRERGALRSTMAPYEQELSELLNNLRAGRPQASCLVMTPVDHGTRVGKRIVSRPVVPRLVAAQRKVARAAGCAFFDTYRAMGGEGSVGRWFRKKPRLMSPDLSHPSVHGQRVIGGKLLFEAIMAAYGEFRRQRSGRPLPRKAQPTAKVESGPIEPPAARSP